MAQKSAEKEASAPAVEKASSKKTVKKDKPTRKKLPKAIRVPLTPFIAFGKYLKGSWQELRQVRWPNRRATWALTLAVILFTVFFVIIIVALDAAFKALFERIIL